MRSIAGPPRARGPARERSPLLLPSKLQLSSAERHRAPRLRSDSTTSA